MRTIMWVFICALFTAVAVQGLEISSRHFARQETLGDFEMPPALVDMADGEHHSDMESSRHAR